MAAAKHILNKKLLFQLGVGAVVLGAAVLFLLRGYDWRSAIDTSLAVVRDAGPWTFFGAMVVLPAFGFPLSPFLLTAGPVFGPVLGVPAVIALTCLAILGNVMLAYSLARWLLHPPLEKLVIRLGYKMPRIGPDNYWDITILVRVTPGPPFFVQNYILGLGHVPVRIYLIVSMAVVWVNATALVIFGDALLKGRGGMVLFGLSLLAAIGVGTHLVRKHFARKRAAELADLG